MLKKLTKLSKYAIYGTGITTLSLLAIKMHNNRQIQNIVKEDKQTINKNTQMLNGQPNLLNQIQEATNSQQYQKNQQVTHHQHNSDIRVLDMVGFPAIDGQNIVQIQQKVQKKQDPIQKEQKQATSQQIKGIQQHKQQEKIQITQQKIQQVQNPQQKMQSPLQTQENTILIKAQNQNQKLQTKQNVSATQNKKSNGQNEKGVSQIVSRPQIFKKISEIPQFNINQAINPQDYIIIVADLPYNQTFQNQVLSKLAYSMKKRKSSKPLNVYRLKINQQDVKQFLVKNGATVKQQTILLMKNPYQNKFVNIDFDMYIQHINVPSIYLSELKIADSKEKLQRQLRKMTPNDTYLLLVVDMVNDTDIARRKLTAKYIQMEMGVHNIQNLKLYIIDEKIAKQQGLISNDTKANTLHLIRKSNQFTFKKANRNIYDNSYHILQNISLYDKQRSLMIPRYMSKVETFSSMNLQAPFVCSIVIDRNRVTPKQQRQILKVFAELKESKQFQHVSFVLKFGQTQYRGAKQDRFANKKWAIKVANLNEIDKQLIMHQIKQLEDASSLGITQKDWQRRSFQYLYKQPQVTKQGLKNFLYSCVSGQQQEFYKTEAKVKLQNTEKIIGSTFQQKIFNNDKSHLVFQYSDHCQACQLLSPVIDYFGDVCSKFPQINIKVHSLNCDKNKVKGQPYSPYTPNLYYYSRKWRNRDPIKYNIIEYINHTNVWGIYDFCIITDSLTPISIEKFQENIKNFMDNKVNLTDF